MMPRIIIQDCHEPRNLDSLEILVNHQKPQLSEEIEKKVKENWNRFKIKRKNAKDNQIAYLVLYTPNDNKTKIEVFLAGFSYNQFFNRDDTEMVYSAVSNKFDYNPMASWMAITCDDKKYLLFGNKKDFGKKKVSGFCGFTTADDFVDEKIDANKWTQRKLKEETGDEISKRIERIRDIGLNFYPIVGPKGFDEVFIVDLDGKVENLQKEFRENPQFSKQLIPVRTDPRSLVEFLESEDWEPTWSCIGGIFNYIGATWGLDELKRSLSNYSKRDIIRIGDQN